MSPSSSPDRYIPFSRPSIGAREEQAVLEVLRSGWLTTADRTREFEERFAKFVGSDHAVALNSGTAGLHLSLEALGVQAGDLVVTTPYTFTATAETIRYLGAHPLFVDIEPDSFNIDPDAVDDALKKHRVRCVVPVHFGGAPCRMDALLEATARRGVPIVEDAAHAFPSRSDWGFAGTAGSAGVYSFYANKTITTGEGGMVVTNDESTASRIRVMSLHGIDRPVWNRFTDGTGSAWAYDVVAPGFKYNMTDIAAAIGLVQLSRADAFLSRRTEIASRYIEAFSDSPLFCCPSPDRGHAWHLFVLRLRVDRLTADRDRFATALSERGVGTSVHYRPLHLMSYYRDTYHLTPAQLPNATARYEQALSLPIYPDLESEEVDAVIEAVNEVGEELSRD